MVGDLGISGREVRSGERFGPVWGKEEGTVGDAGPSVVMGASVGADPSWSQPEIPNCSNSLMAEQDVRSIIVPHKIPAVIQFLKFFILSGLFLEFREQAPFLFAG